MGDHLDITQIMHLLPHRYPFLLVDRVVSYVPKESLTAYKNVSINEGFFQGHFPGRPVMPGVLIIEAMAQAGGILVYLSLGDELAGKVSYMTGMEKIRFRRPVVPGDRLDMTLKFIRLGSRFWKMSGEATVDGQMVCEGVLMAALADAV